MQNQENNAISVDKQQRFAVSLKGSSLVSERTGETANFEDPGSAGQALNRNRSGGNPIQVFDKQVERASREMKRGFQIRVFSQNR